MPATTDYLQRLRQRLLLDWDDPIFSGPLFVGTGGAARKKLTELVSPRSEDAIAWSVFRTLARLPSETWLPVLLSACVSGPTGAATPLTMEFWPRVTPSASRLLWMLNNLDLLRFHDPRQQEAAEQRILRVRLNLERWKAQVQQGPSERGDGIFEAPSDLGVVLKGPGVLVVIEGKYTGDIEVCTPWDPQRDQIARRLDAALELAGDQREPYFLLVTDDYVHEGPSVAAIAYESLFPKYREDPVFRAARLPHRSEAELARLEGHIGWLSWADLVDLVLDHSAEFTPAQKGLLKSLVDYLKGKRLLYKGG